MAEVSRAAAVRTYSQALRCPTLQSAGHSGGILDSNAAGFQSEIRQSDINQLVERVETLKYRKYLRRVSLATVRGFTDQTVSFDFPVTAIVRPNSGGKTTVLGAAALA